MQFLFQVGHGTPSHHETRTRHSQAPATDRPEHPLNLSPGEALTGSAAQTGRGSFGSGGASGRGWRAMTALSMAAKASSSRGQKQQHQVLGCGEPDQVVAGTVPRNQLEHVGVAHDREEQQEIPVQPEHDRQARRRDRERQTDREVNRGAGWSPGQDPREGAHRVIHHRGDLDGGRGQQQHSPVTPGQQLAAAARARRGDQRGPGQHEDARGEHLQQVRDEVEAGDPAASRPGDGGQRQPPQAQQHQGGDDRLAGKGDVESGQAEQVQAADLRMARQYARQDRNPGPGTGAGTAGPLRGSRPAARTVARQR